MKFLQRLFNFYINSSIHIALAVYALVRITELYFNLENNSFLHYTIFFGTIVGYNFIKYSGFKKMRQKHSLKTIKTLNLISFVLTFFFGSQLELRTILWSTPFAILTFLYAIPILNVCLNLRNIPKLKIVIIGIVWAGVTVLLPIVNANVAINYKMLLVFMQRFLFVIVLTLPFDIRDVFFDKRNLQTVPQLIGIKQTKKLGFILLALTMVLEFYVTSNSIFKSVFLVVFVVLLLFLQRASVKQNKYYSAFWVEAIPIFWWMLLLFGLSECFKDT